MTGSHTSERICELLNNEINECGASMPVGIVTDNARNMRKAIKLMGVHWYDLSRYLQVNMIYSQGGMFGSHNSPH